MQTFQAKHNSRDTGLNFRPASSLPPIRPVKRIRGRCVLRSAELGGVGEKIVLGLDGPQALMGVTDLG